MVRITIDIGPSRKTGGVEAFGLGMMMPFVIDAVLGILAPAPPAPELVPGPGPAHPRMPPFVEWLHRAIAEVMVAPPAPAAAAADKNRIADFVTTMLRDLRPRERELLRRRFGVDVPEPAPPGAPEPAPAPAPGGTV